MIELARDWILGEFAATGRPRSSLLAVMETLHRFGGTPVGQAKLAREAGLANNTIAAGYIELLMDLLCVACCYAWDPARNRHNKRRPCKYHMINLLAAVAWHPARIRSPVDFERLSEASQACLLEWLVAQELWRRAAVRGDELPEVQAFWQSKSHELDFMLDPASFIEVKRGKCSPIEFAWFTKALPKERSKIGSPAKAPLLNALNQQIERWPDEEHEMPWELRVLATWLSVLDEQYICSTIYEYLQSSEHLHKRRGLHLVLEFYWTADSAIIDRLFHILQHEDDLVLAKFANSAIELATFRKPVGDVYDLRAPAVEDPDELKRLEREYASQCFTRWREWWHANQMEGRASWKKSTLPELVEIARALNDSEDPWDREEAFEFYSIATSIIGFSFEPEDEIHGLNSEKWDRALGSGIEAFVDWWDTEGIAWWEQRWDNWPIYQTEGGVWDIDSRTIPAYPPLAPR